MKTASALSCHHYPLDRRSDLTLDGPPALMLLLLLQLDRGRKWSFSSCFFFLIEWAHDHNSTITLLQFFNLRCQGYQIQTAILFNLTCPCFVIWNLILHICPCFVTWNLSENASQIREDDHACAPGSPAAEYGPHRCSDLIIPRVLGLSDPKSKTYTHTNACCEKNKSLKLGGNLVAFKSYGLLLLSSP